MTRPRLLSFGVVIAATAATLVLGYAIKSPCLGPWDGRQYTRLCYSDVIPLFHTEGLDRGRVPYLEADNEYPVLTGFTQALAGIPANDYPSFFRWNALLLSALALVTAGVLHHLTGLRALFFAAAPTLLIYAFVNWDLLAVALATLATWAFLRRRDGPAAVALGLGAAAKLYPALLVVPFTLARIRERRWDRAALIGGGAALTWAAINLPFALVAPGRWSTFFRFNADRPADWDSMWRLLQRHVGWFESTWSVNLGAVIAFIVVSGLVWWAVSRVRPGFPAWTFGFPLLVAWLLTNKVYSPQFSLWLLPWFALVLPRLPLFLAFSIAEIGVFATRFLFFAEMEGLSPSLPLWTFEIAILVRAAVLVTAVVMWVRGGREDAPEIRAPAAPATAEVAA